MVFLLLRPHRWQKGKYTKIVEEAFANYFLGSQAVGFDSEGTALGQILKGWGIGSGDTVIVSALTAPAVISAVSKHAAIPLFADVEGDTFNLDVQKLGDLESKRAAAIVVSHAFGQAANLGKIIPWARKRKLKIIEDCSQALGARYRGEKLGTFGDVAVFSLDRSGSLPSVGGGLAVTSDPRLSRALIAAQRRLAFPSMKRIAQNFLVGSDIPPNGYWRLPNFWAALAYRRFIQIDGENQHRRQVASYYLQLLKGISLVKLPRIEEGAEPSFFSFVIRVPDPGRLVQTARKRRVSLDSLGERRGISPAAAKIATKMVILPTNVSLKRAEKVVKVIKEHYQPEADG
jgi:dTDP-4-amino-4,6-dideoxygalactose transaminase